MRWNTLIFLFTSLFVEIAMAADPNTTDELAQMKKQVESLTLQLTLMNSQHAVDVAKQIQDVKLTQAVAEALKNQTSAEFLLQSEQAKGPFAELSGIKAATSGLSLPTGKNGTVQVAAGTAGAALLRSKGPMLGLLNAVATELSSQLPDGAVIVTEAQIEQAYQAIFIENRIEQQTKNLTEANRQAKPAEPSKLAMGMPQVVAAAYSAGLILDTVNSLGKLFRIDRKVDIFSTDAEAGQMLGYLLEAKNKKFVANPAVMRQEALSEANSLLAKLTELLKAVQTGDAILAQLKKIEEDEAKSKPAPEKITELNAQLASAKSLFDSLDPGKKPDQFWSQVKGQLLHTAIKDRDRLLVETKAQALQITESRWYATDRMSLGGEVQIAYRILNKDGGLEKSGVILKASKPEKTSLDEMQEVSFPAKQ